MGTANTLRGEVNLPLGGRSLRLRPTYAALALAEQETGSFFALVERAAAGQLRLADMEALLWSCLDPRPDDLTRAMFADALVDAGIVHMTPVLRALIEAVLAGQA